MVEVLFKDDFLIFTLAKLSHLEGYAYEKEYSRFASIMTVVLKLWIYVTSCVEQNKKTQTLKSVQNGLKLIFNGLGFSKIAEPDGSYWLHQAFVLGTFSHKVN